jgi:hypothetical protein
MGKLFPKEEGTGTTAESDADNMLANNWLDTSSGPVGTAPMSFSEPGKYPFDQAGPAQSRIQRDCEFLAAKD